MAALRLKHLRPDQNVVVFDKSSKLGGMYASLNYPDGVVFDHGMHVIYESCNSEIDDLYREIMPATDWHIYEGNDKDIAGLFFRGKLQTFSHYVDLRSFPSEARQKFIGDLFLAKEKPRPEEPKCALEFLRAQFGQEIVKTVHEPLLRGLYGIDPETIDILAVNLTALERVIFFGSDLMLDLMKSETIRSCIAFPDQINLPPYRENSQRALYPRKFGMDNFVERLRDRLLSMGVEILTGYQACGIDRTSSGISQIKLKSAKGEEREFAVDKLLWTIGWPAFTHALKIDISDLSFQRGPRIVFLNLIFDRPPRMDGLYYFYCYDLGFASFRVTNYSNYCPAAGEGGRYPMCVEFWPSRIGLDADGLEANECIGIALDELRKFGVIEDEHQLVFSEVENHGAAFPMPTVENTASLDEIRRRVLEQDLHNVAVAGIMAEKGLFFLPDILNDAFEKIAEF